MNSASHGTDGRGEARGDKPRCQAKESFTGGIEEMPPFRWLSLFVVNCTPHTTAAASRDRARFRL